MNVKDIRRRYNLICEEAYLLEKIIKHFEDMLSEKRKYLIGVKAEMVYLDRLIQSEGEENC